MFGVHESSSYESLLAKAISFVSYRPRSRRELEVYLQKHDASAEDSERVIGRMTELKYVDDAEFAKKYAHDILVVRRKGPSVARRMLTAKGIDTGCIEKTLLDLASDDTIPDEVARARSAIGRRLAAWNTLPPRQRNQKVRDFLFRRGFPASMIRTLVDDSHGSDYNTDYRNGGDEQDSEL